MLTSGYSSVAAISWRRPNKKRALTIFNLKYNIDKKYYDCRCPIYKVCRKFIGHIGTASAKILISSVVKEDKISLPEVLRILGRKHHYKQEVDGHFE
jgi:hypothetical protein